MKKAELTECEKLLKEVIKMNRRWTSDEVEYLQENYGLVSDECISNKLNRTNYSIVSKAQKLGVRKIDNGELITITEFCESTGLHRSSVEYWIEHANFPTVKKGKYRKVSSVKFWNWASKNKQRINWSDFPEKTIFNEPTWVSECRRKNIRRTSKRRRWTDWEINELKRLVKQNRFTYAELSEKLNRNHSAIKRKIYDLKLLYTPIATSKNNYYSENEVQQAIDQLQKGIELVVVAKELNRSEMGLREKLIREGYYSK